MKMNTKKSIIAVALGLSIIGSSLPLSGQAFAKDVSAKTNQTAAVQRTDALNNGVFPVGKGYKFRNNFGEKRTWTPQGRQNRPHQGIDISAPKGTPIYSATDGKIIRYGWNQYGGWRITIKSGSYTLYYAHMDRYAKGLSNGATVKKGQLIGYVGKTGYGPVGTQGMKAPHLHFGLFKNGSLTNPFPYLKKWE